MVVHADMRARIRGKLSFGAWLPVIWRLEEAGNAVGLTFDDGPSVETTPALLDLLDRHGATATFFVNGQRAAAAMALIDAIVAGGHDVFPHGWRHVRYDEASARCWSRTSTVANACSAACGGLPRPTWSACLTARAT